MITFFIPTYWSRKNGEYKIGDLVFDHPTPINQQGTLLRTLKSFQIFSSSDWKIILFSVATTSEIEDAVKEKIFGIIRQSGIEQKILYLSSKQYKKILGQDQYLHPVEDFLNLNYSNVRNAGLIIAKSLESEVIVMVDDDQVFEDPNFCQKIEDGLLHHIQGEKMLGWTGFCPEKNNSYIRIRPFEPWMKYWNKIETQNQAFEKIIGTPEPRWKVTPFAFGGLLVIRRDLFEGVPFDPYVARGEDMDYCMNVRLLGYDFFQDNALWMKHLPPPRAHPIWRRIREDAMRFLYQKKKLECASGYIQGVHLTYKNFLPYPGAFLGPDLVEKIIKTNQELMQQYSRERKSKDAEECLLSIKKAKDFNLEYNPFKKYLEIQDKWKKIMVHLGSKKNKLSII